MEDPLNDGGVAHQVILSADEDLAIRQINFGKNLDVSAELITAAERGFSTATSLLLRKGADVMARDAYRNTPLHHAVKKNLEEITKLLLEKGANPNTTNEDGDTPLHIACRSSNRRIVELLLEYGALVDSKDSRGDRPLHVALRFHDQSLPQILLKHDADAMAPGERGRTSLHLTAAFGHIAIAKDLLGEGANIDDADSQKRMTLMCASTGRQSTNTLELLFERGANIDQIDEDGRTPLHVAIDYYNLEAAAILIKRGAGVKSRLYPYIYPREHSAHRNVLHDAAESQPIVLEFLLKNGDLDIEFQEGHGWTALALAVEANNEDCVKLLLEYGANPDAKASCDCELYHKVPASHKAAKMGYEGVLQMLLDAGADPSSEDRFGNTPLNWAAEGPSSRCVEALLRTGMVDVNHANWEQATPLYYAATCGRVENVKQLLRRVDVDRKARTTTGVTAKEGALEKGYEEIFNLLEEDEMVIHGTGKPSAAASEFHSHWAACLNSLGVILMRRYSRTKRVEDLKESIRRTEQAISTTTEDDPNIAVYHNNLGIGFLRLFEVTEAEDYIRKAVQQTRKAVIVTPEKHQNHVSYLLSLAIATQKRCLLTAKTRDLRMAVRRTTRVIEVMPKNHPDLARCLNNLGYLNQRLFEETSDMRNHREAVRYTAEAIAAVPRGLGDFAACLNNFGIILAKGFEHKKQSTECLDKAVHRLKQAVAATPKDHPKLGFYLHNLASILAKRSEQKGRLGNLEEALLRAQQAIATAPEDYHGLSSYSSGQVNKLDSAGERAEQVTALTDGDHHRILIYPGSLGEVFQELKRMGSRNDLDDAIVEMKRVTATAFSSRCGFAVCLQTLRNVLTQMPKKNDESRFEDAEGDEHSRASPKRISIVKELSKFGVLLHEVFQRWGRIEDLSKVFEETARKVDLIPVEQRSVAVYLKIQAAVLLAAERAFREDQEEAVRSIRASLATRIPRENPDLVSKLDRLSIILEARFKESETMEDLEEAIRCTEQTVDALTDDRPRLLRRLQTLVALLKIRFDRSGSIDDLEEVVQRDEQMTAAASPVESSSSRSTIDLMVVTYKPFKEPSWRQRQDCSVCCKLEVEAKKKSFEFGELTGTDFDPGRPACSVCAMLRHGLALFDGYERKWFRDDLLDAVKATFFYQRRQGSPLWLHTPWIDLEFFATEGNTEMSRKLILQGSMSGDTSSEVCLSRVVGWIDECMSSHPKCKAGGIVAASLPRRVLDLSAGDFGHEIKLVESQGRLGPYICLSYCWGGMNSITTTRSTLPLRSAGISWDSLPQTFKDAIDVTRRLKVRYLWIDALCIIQDDKKDWEIESSHMASIYANSYLTVAATKSANCTEGLYSEASPGYGSTRQMVYKDTANDESTTIHVREKLDHRQLFYSSGIGVDATYPLMRRSWCFQERLLAPRTLHFMPGKVAWECNTAMRCECSGLDGQSRSLINPKVMFQTDGLAGDDNRNRRLVSQWHDIVHSYVRLSLTFDSDRLPALSGLAKITQQQLHCNYLAGLWECDLWNELRWRFHDRGRVLDERRAYTPSTYRGPSWSWIAIENLPQRIYYDFSKSVETDYCFLRLLDVQCRHLGEDPTGEVDCAFLKVAGYVKHVTMGHYWWREPGFPGDEHFTVTSGKWTSKFLADCPEALKNGERRLEDGDELFCLRMGRARLREHSRGSYRSQSSTSSNSKYLPVRERRSRRRLVEVDRYSSSAGLDEIAEPGSGRPTRQVRRSWSDSVSEQSVLRRVPMASPYRDIRLESPRERHDSPSDSAAEAPLRRPESRPSSSQDYIISPAGPRRRTRRSLSTDSYSDYAPRSRRTSRRSPSADSYSDYAPGPRRMSRRPSYYSSEDSRLSPYEDRFRDSDDDAGGESNSLSPAPSLIIDNLPHLPSVSEDEVDDCPRPPPPHRQDSEIDAEALGQLIESERIAADPPLYSNRRGGPLPCDYLVLRRLNASEYQNRAGGLYSTLLEGKKRQDGDFRDLANASREGGEENQEGGRGVGMERQWPKLGTENGVGVTFAMYERVGLVPQWEITMEQDSEWFADVEESLVVIV